MIYALYNSSNSIHDNLQDVRITSHGNLKYSVRNQVFIKNYIDIYKDTSHRRTIGLFCARTLIASKWDISSNVYLSPK